MTTWLRLWMVMATLVAALWPGEAAAKDEFQQLTIDLDTRDAPPPTDVCVIYKGSAKGLEIPTFEEWMAGYRVEAGPQEKIDGFVGPHVLALDSGDRLSLDRFPNERRAFDKLWDPKHASDACVEDPTHAGCRAALWADQEELREARVLCTPNSSVASDERRVLLLRLELLVRTTTPSVMRLVFRGSALGVQVDHQVNEIQSTVTVVGGHYQPRHSQRGYGDRVDLAVVPVCQRRDFELPPMTLEAGWVMEAAVQQGDTWSRVSDDFTCFERRGRALRLTVPTGPAGRRKQIRISVRESEEAAARELMRLVARWSSQEVPPDLTFETQLITFRWQHHRCEMLDIGEEREACPEADLPALGVPCWSVGQAIEVDTADPEGVEQGVCRYVCGHRGTNAEAARPIVLPTEVRLRRESVGEVRRGVLLPASSDLAEQRGESRTLVVDFDDWLGAHEDAVWTSPSLVIRRANRAKGRKSKKAGLKTEQEHLAPTRMSTRLDLHGRRIDRMVLVDGRGKEHPILLEAVAEEHEPATTTGVARVDAAPGRGVTYALPVSELRCDERFAVHVEGAARYREYEVDLDHGVVQPASSSVARRRTRFVGGAFLGLDFQHPEPGIGVGSGTFVAADAGIGFEPRILPILRLEAGAAARLSQIRISRRGVAVEPADVDVDTRLFVAWTFPLRVAFRWAPDFLQRGNYPTTHFEVATGFSPGFGHRVRPRDAELLWASHFVWDVPVEFRVWLLDRLALVPAARIGQTSIYRFDDDGLGSPRASLDHLLYGTVELGLRLSL